MKIERSLQNEDMPKDVQDEYDAYLAKMKPSAQTLAGDIPPGSVIITDDAVLYVIGYNDADPVLPSLIVSVVDPRVDYDEAVKEENKRRICYHCLTGRMHTHYNLSPLDPA